MNEKILIIDREADIRKDLETLLRKNGYLVRSASRADEAIEALKSTSFDLVIMDIRIPDMNGLQLMKQIKDIDDDLEVIVLTGATSPKDIINVLRGSRGAIDFLSKPLDNLDQLTVSIERALVEQKLKREKRF